MKVSQEPVKLTDVLKDKTFTVPLYGKLPPKLKRFEIESVKQKLYEKFKIYGVTNSSIKNLQ